MRLFNVETLKLETHHRLKQQYAIASHRWDEGNEASFQDVQAERNQDCVGYQKILQFASFVRNHVHGVKYLWIDTCCIDKTNSQELQEAITSMYKWYEGAVICLAYLYDVQAQHGGVRTDDIGGLGRSVWFTRGWTLQELLAPSLVVFLADDWTVLGHKSQDNDNMGRGTPLRNPGPKLNLDLSGITGIPEAIVTRAERRRSVGVDDKMKWMARRTTTRPEDIAYCQLGLFEVSMPLIYGEGQAAAVRRLKQAIEDARKEFSPDVPIRPLSSSDRCMVNSQGRQETIYPQAVFQEPRSQEGTNILDAEIYAFLQKLFANTYPYEDRKDRNRRPVNGTCVWFANHETFRTWDSPQADVDHDRGSPILYVTADPGCGKSVLSRHLVDTVLARDGRTVCYAFFKGDFEGQKTSLGAVCALLHQLLRLNKQVFYKEKRILERFKLQGDNFFDSFAAVWATLITAAAASQEEVVCVLDALDECSDNDRRQLLAAIGQASNSNLRFLLTSRPYGHIEREVMQQSDDNEISFICIQGDQDSTAEEIEHEVRIVIEYRIQQVAKSWRLHETERQLLEETILKIPNRSYLWATLVFDGLMSKRNGVTKREILDIATTLPQGIYDVYENLLAKSLDPAQTRKLLNLVLAAGQPLSLAEIAPALAFRKQTSWPDFANDIIPETRIREHVRDLCGLFIIVIHQKVYLLHHTAREFLLQHSPYRQEEGGPMDRMISRPTNWLWRHSISMAKAHGVFVETCVRILRLYHSENNFLHRGLADDGDAKWDPPFIRYAFSFWLWHYGEALIEDCEATTDLEHILCSPPGNSWPKPVLQRLDIKPGESMLHIASILGLDGFANKLLNECLESDRRAEMVNARDETGRTPLHYAAGIGHKRVVEVLLTAAEIDVDAVHEAGQGETALYLAAVGLRSNADIVKLLIETGKANADIEDDNCRTPFSVAAESDKKEIMELLLAIGNIDVNHYDRRGFRPLHHAIEAANDEIVQLLLTADEIDINAEDDNGMTPLHWAASLDSPKIVARLLATGKADIEYLDRHGMTPLHHAAYNGPAENVKLLLETGKVNVSSVDNFHYTPLHYAASSGSTDNVKLLLETGILNVSSMDRYHQTLLHRAASSGSIETFKLLLETGKVNVSSVDYCNETPLHCAAFSGSTEIVQLLLETGKVNVSSMNNCNETPLHCAACSGSAETVKLLLETGKVNVSSLDKYDPTLLHCAIFSGSTETVKLLLETGNANVSRVNNDNQTPLQFAASKGYTEIVQLLSA